MRGTKRELFDPAELFERLYIRLYIFMAKEMKDTFGEEGVKAVERALVKLGHDRGKILREKHNELGLPITVKSLFSHYDLPANEEFVRRNTIKLTDTVRYSRTHNCHWQETWRKLAPNDPDLWQLYCNTIHQAVFEGYLDNIVCELPLLLTKGDEYCQFEVYLKGHKDEIHSDEKGEQK
jgi:hypothetical protein